MKLIAQQQGFSLFEVLIATVVAVIALLGLALLEIKMLQSAQSSFQYTVSTIRANNLVDSIWLDLCNAQTDPARYTALVSNWQQSLPSGYSVTTDKPGVSFALSTTIELNWQDSKIAEADNNKLTLLANFPDVCN
ncbi:MULTISPECIES: prepilin-type N-terminal cleavage/methylation domain-containing protein [unclassified Motilimonas]|uniref:type IV pilus modification PilV family protein n=1 Tax=Motilimonas TaxID=1914248 RepID=UPI001E310A5E|nr:MULTISPECIES: prepilin-type N-terminal cleavage/methylation domain-containing protein [unclassified Motilimonas]MCE0558821.1 prepilin-type N-terminal cleavage/methylation domain-containing protein [Motilimonas sp. E26]MDO6526532.1 prepilin-type N-terminal cleavage/methylation domain-containing protein [Motilimonas sp. 1_MG-2023]